MGKFTTVLFAVCLFFFFGCGPFEPFQVIPSDDIQNISTDSLRLLISSPSGIEFTDESTFQNDITLNDHLIISGDATINTNVTSHIHGTGEGSITVSNIGIDTFKNITFSFWIKSYAGRYSFWISKGDISNQRSQLEVDFSRLDFGQVLNSNNSNHGPSINELYLNGEWTMVTVVAHNINDDFSDRAYIYKDGILLDSIDNTVIEFNSKGELKLFRDLHGFVDNIRIYNTILENNDIRTIYELEKADFPNRDWNDLVVPSGLFMFFNFDEFPIYDVKEGALITNSNSINDLSPLSPNDQSFSYNFDDTNESIVIDKYQLPDVSAFSAVFWILPELPLSNFVLFTDSKSEESEFRYDSVISRFGFGEPIFGSMLSYNPDFRIASGEWTMVTITASRVNAGSDNNTIKLYLNNNEQPVAVANTSNVDFSRQGEIIIGTNHLENSFYKGKIDNIRFYNRELSSQEIIEIYNNEN